MFSFYIWIRDRILSSLENYLLNSAGSPPPKCPMDSLHRAIKDKYISCGLPRNVFSWLPEANLKWLSEVCWLSTSINLFFLYIIRFCFRFMAKLLPQVLAVIRILFSWPDLSQVYTPKNGNICPWKDLYMNNHSSFIHNIQKLEATQITIKQWYIYTRKY